MFVRGTILLWQALQSALSTSEWGKQHTYTSAYLNNTEQCSWCCWSWVSVIFSLRTRGNYVNSPGHELGSEISSDPGILLKWSTPYTRLNPSHCTCCSLSSIWCFDGWWNITRLKCKWSRRSCPRGPRPEEWRRTCRVHGRPGSSSPSSCVASDWIWANWIVMAFDCCHMIWSLTRVRNVAMNPGKAKNRGCLSQSYSHFYSSNPTAHSAQSRMMHPSLANVCSSDSSCPDKRLKRVGELDPWRTSLT